ncbi:Na+/H+ antiporter [Klebsiella pneumoniae]|nr:Na+/H+ antiporter [Klebsiella pneumoniae]
MTRVLPFQVPLPTDCKSPLARFWRGRPLVCTLNLDPELFLVLFIPPLLFADGWKTPTREFIEHGREILGLALALVVVTVVGIGFLIYWIVPGIPLIPAFALAAVLSPTDAVALSGIVGEGRIPKKIMGILQGEALMNDASGLVSLKFAVAVAMGTMVFTVGGATVEFLKVAIGGVLAGFVVSWSYGRSMRFLSRWGGDEPATQIVLLFLLPFASFLIAEHSGVSCILAAVAVADDHHTFWRDAHRALGHAPARQQHLGNVGFLSSHGMIFLLLDLQLPDILSKLAGGGGGRPQRWHLDAVYRHYPDLCRADAGAFWLAVVDA